MFYPVQSTSDDARSPQQAPPGLLLAGFLSIALIGLWAAAYWQGDGSLDAVRFIGRLMIRITAVLFSLSFVASALVRLFPSAPARWIFANRRNFTISYAVAFILHLGAIARFYTLDAGAFWSVSPPVLIFSRGIGAVFIVLMLLDALKGNGTRRWMTLNTVGEYYVWAGFLNGFGKRVVLDRFNFLPVALLILALTLRLWPANRSQPTFGTLRQPRRRKQLR
jgi:hypothetical protein